MRTLRNAVLRKTRTWQTHQPKAVTTNSTMSLVSCFLSADGIILSQTPLMPCSSCVDRWRTVRLLQDGAPLFRLWPWLGSLVGRFGTWRLWDSAINIRVCRRTY